MHHGLYTRCCYDKDLKRAQWNMHQSCYVSRYQPSGLFLQKDIVRDVMLKLDAGPRQLSRVSGLPYSIVYKLKKL